MVTYDILKITFMSVKCVQILNLVKKGDLNSLDDQLGFFYQQVELEPPFRSDSDSTNMCFRKF